MNTLKISINKITKCLVISKKIGKCNCMRFFFCWVYIVQQSKKNHHFDHIFIENHIFVYKYFYEISLHAF